MRMRTALLTIVLYTFTTAAYADENPTVTQDKKDYDWQTCTYTKLNDCVADCQNSEDMNCTNSCPDLAKSKCISEGLNPPSDANSIDSVQ